MAKTPAIAADLGRRLHRALTATADELFQVMLDPAMAVLRNALKNRQLNEDHLQSLLKRRDLSEDLLKAVAQLEQSKTSHGLKLALVKNPATPGPIVLHLLPQLHLFELVGLCYTPGITPDQKYAVERAILQRLPTTELGNRMTLARRATPTIVGEILKSGEPQLVEICLSNPRLREVAILQFLNGATATAETISMVARHPKWKTRPNLKMAILKNRRTPPIWYTVFLPGLRTPDLRNLLASRRLAPAAKPIVEQELRKRLGR
ncbi:MAG: hypothetical protein RQ723_01940 [Desulfuromonadales bacterium]|nr:hypothetical protein [Desulfuromonadales bacterium]